MFSHESESVRCTWPLISTVICCVKTEGLIKDTGSCVHSKGDNNW